MREGKEEREGNEKKYKEKDSEMSMSHRVVSNQMGSSGIWMGKERESEMEREKKRVFHTCKGAKDKKKKCI